MPAEASLDGARVHSLEGLHDGVQPGGFRLGQRARIGGLAVHVELAFFLERDVRIHLLGAQRILLAHHRSLGRHLGVLNLAALVFHGNFGVQFVLADGALVLHRGHAAQIDRVVGGLEVGFARFGFQRTGNVRRRLDGQDGHAQNLQPQRANLRLRAQAGLGMSRDFGGRQQGFLEREGLDLLLDDDLHLHPDAVAELERILRRIALAVGLERKIHEPGRQLGRLDLVGNLALHRDVLEIGSHQAQHERVVGAGHRHRHHGRRGRVVIKGLSRAFANRLPPLELDQVDRGLGLDEPDAKHAELLGLLKPIGCIKQPNMSCIIQLNSSLSNRSRENHGDQTETPGL
jgi:hypothetical protein